MAASPHDYLTNVEDEINDPASFLPTALRHDGKNLLWTKPAYATYRGTPVMAETIESSFLCDLKSVQLPPNMERMSKQSTITAHQEEYIGEYTLAAATLDHWYSHNQNHNKLTMEEAIKTWKLTCDKLTQKPVLLHRLVCSSLLPLLLLPVHGWLTRLPYYFPSQSTQ